MPNKNVKVVQRGLVNSESTIWRLYFLFALFLHPTTCIYICVYINLPTYVYLYIDTDICIHHRSSCSRSPWTISAPVCISLWRTEYYTMCACYSARSDEVHGKWISRFRPNLHADKQEIYSISHFSYYRSFPTTTHYEPTRENKVVITYENLMRALQKTASISTDNLWVPHSIPTFVFGHFGVASRNRSMKLFLSHTSQCVQIST